MANVEVSPVDPRRETFKLSDAAVGRSLRSVRGSCFAASDGECLEANATTSALAGLWADARRESSDNEQICVLPFLVESLCLAWSCRCWRRAASRPLRPPDDFSEQSSTDNSASKMRGSLSWCVRRRQCGVSIRPSRTTSTSMREHAHTSVCGGGEMIPHVPLYLTVTCSVLVSLEKYKQVNILGDDFRIRFCIQPLAWFNSRYSSYINATVTRQCRPSPRPTCSQTETSSLLTPNASVRGSSITTRRPMSFLTVALSLLASRASVKWECHHSLKSYSPPVGNVITVGVKRSFVPALFPEVALQSQELYERDVEEEEMRSRPRCVASLWVFSLSIAWAHFTRGAFHQQIH